MIMHYFNLDCNQQFYLNYTVKEFGINLDFLGQKFRVYDYLLIGPVQKPVDGQNDGHVLSRKSNGIQNHDHRDKS